MNLWDDYFEVMRTAEPSLSADAQFLPCASNVVAHAIPVLATSGKDYASTLIGVVSSAMRVGYLMGERSAMLAPFERAMEEIDD